MKTKLILLLLCIYQFNMAQNPAKLWTPVSQTVLKAGTERLIIPKKYQNFRAATAALKSALNNAPVADLQNSTAIIELPMPDGSTQRFKIVESLVMAPELAAQFPSIKTYDAMGIDQPGTYGKLDFTDFGFHGMLLGTSGTIFIDPAYRNNDEDYISYYANDFEKEAKTFCQVEEVAERKNKNSSMQAAICSGSNLRTYRLAIACTGEYAIAATGKATPTVSEILSAVTTTIARVDGVYETEVAVKLVLIGAEASLLFPDPATDPFNGNSNASVLINESQQVIDNIAGDGNYDIGHTFSTGGGGLAGLGVVCRSTQKGRGITGSANPKGDPYDIDYVCHEIGHQFGCNHSYNQCTNNATQNPGTMVEPGSGITIMGYAGICAAKDNLSANSIPYFHTISFDELMAYSTTGSGNSCAVTSASGNAPPSVESVLTYTIPKLTAFELKGKATDPNNDVLTYSWEQTDNNSTPHDLGLSAPYFRTNAPVNSPSRTFIPIAELLQGKTSILGEYLPATAQTLNFRLTARDNKMGGGGVCYTDAQLVIAATGPFQITSQKTPTTWTACKTERITWDVAGSDQLPISTSKVDILYSVDGGVVFIPLISNVPNSGTCDISVPTVSTTKGRIMIKSVGNVFFAVNLADITINGLCANFEATLNNTPRTNIDRGQALTFKDLSVGNPTGWEWSFEGGTPATSTDQHPVVTYNTPGTFKVELKAKDGAGQSTIVKNNYITVNATYNKGQAYTCISIDTAKNIWAGTNKAGVFFLDKKTTPGASQFNLMPYSGTFDPSKFIVQSIACDSLGNTWVAHGGTGLTTASAGGMERIDYNNTGTIQHYGATSQTRCLKLGENEGLASRNVQCVVVDRNNTVWTAHRYHDLTVTNPAEYLVTPGGFSYKTTAATIFTSKSSWTDYQNGLEPPEFPYPAYTCNPKPNETAQTRTCTSIACGKDEVWVSVYPYTAINGASFPSRLLRYDLNGNFIAPSIDFQTIGIPPGGIFNGIYLDKKGNAWVTVSAGKGFAVKIDGAWKYIKPGDMPCVFPAGATINQNAIWGNKFGNVFIGTNKGLIVYNGEGNVNSAASYSFYELTKDSGAGRNVTGGVSENDSIQWIASDDGIVRKVIGRYDMTANDIDYTSCNNAEINTVEASIKNGESNQSYHNYEVVTVICDKASTRYPDHCNAEHVYAMMKQDVTLTAPTPADYPSNIIELIKNQNQGIFFSLMTEGPFLTALSALTNSELSDEQSNHNPNTVISCSPYRLYGNVNSVILHALYDSGPSLRYFKDCSWTAAVLFPYDFLNSMDDYCGNKLLDIKYDPIWMFANDKKKIITNYTAPGHILYPGKIERTVVEECGVVKIVTRGVGTQYCGDNCRGKVMGQANIVLGSFMFNSIDTRLKRAFDNGQ